VLCNSDTITLRDLPDRIKTHPETFSNNLKDTLSQYEKKIIIERLTQYNWNKEETARSLGIDIATLYRKMKRLGIEG
jgi:transcriptional regulator of acetoin/glycerol metabolism